MSAHCGEGDVPVFQKLHERRVRDPQVVGRLLRGQRSIGGHCESFSFAGRRLRCLAPNLRRAATSVCRRRQRRSTSRSLPRSQRRLHQGSHWHHQGQAHCRSGSDRFQCPPDPAAPARVLALAAGLRTALHRHPPTTEDRIEPVHQPVNGETRGTTAEHHRQRGRKYRHTHDWRTQELRNQSQTPNRVGGSGFRRGSKLRMVHTGKPHKKALHVSRRTTC